MMKVLCEYCGSYVDADASMLCPNCCGSISDAVKAAEEKIQQETAVRKLEEEAKERQRQEAERDEKLLEIFAGVAGAAAGSYFGRGGRRGIGKLIARLIRRFN